MRTDLTIGLIAGSEVWEFLHGPETDIPTHRAIFKGIRGHREHPRYAEVQLWESGAGMVVRHRFQRPPAPSPGVVALDPPPSADGVLAEHPPETETEPQVEDDSKADFAVPTGPTVEAPARPRRRR